MNKISYQYENRLIRRSSIRYILPPMLGMIFAQIAPVIDGICISGTMGEEALAALSTVGPINYGLNIIAALGGIGCGVVISRCSGAGEKGKAARVFTRGIILMVAVTLLLSFVGALFVNPLLTFLCAALLNMFGPSGGGHWAIQAPIMFGAGEALHVDHGLTGIAIAWGDAWTNLIQPFWALPALAIAKLQAKDIMGYCLIDLVVSGIIICGGLLVWSALGVAV